MARYRAHITGEFWQSYGFEGTTFRTFESLNDDLAMENAIVRQSGDFSSIARVDLFRQFQCE